jgi:hypothetical protein
MKAAARLGMSAITDPKQQLALAIRGWIHMDNLAESLTHQAANARKLRNKHEEDSIQLIKQLGLSKSTIKVSGASLALASRKAREGLTWSYLEKEIAAWSTKTGLSPTQNMSLIKWLQEHRGSSEIEYLKKSVV